MGNQVLHLSCILTNVHVICRQPGVRILTLYLYLNDVENGGGTNFDELDITVMPKRGRALLWPSVLDSNPNQKDDRTTHQALPVGKDSLKYGANVSPLYCDMFSVLHIGAQCHSIVCWIHCFRRGFTNATSKGPMSTTVTNNVKMMFMLSFFTYIGFRDDST